MSSTAGSSTDTSAKAPEVGTIEMGLRPGRQQMGAPRGQDAASGTGVELSAQLPEPRLIMVYRLEGALGEPLEIGDVSTGHRRIIHLDGGTVTCVGAVL